MSQEDINLSPVTREKMADGIYKDLPNDRYHSTSAISSSVYKVLHEEGTMAHVWFKWVCGNQDKNTNALRIGTAIHLAFEGEQAWNREVIIKPVRQRRSNADKEFWKQFEEEHKGKVLVTEKEAKNAWRAAQTSIRHPWLKNLFSTMECARELSVYTSVDGEQERIRPDALFVSMDGGTAHIVDYKSTISAQRDKFSRQAANLFYDLSAEMYKDVLRRAMPDLEEVKFSWFAVEKTPLWCGRPIRQDVSMIARGEYLLAQSRAQFRYSLATNSWPGFPAGEIAVGCPRFAMPAALSLGRRG